MTAMPNKQMTPLAEAPVLLSLVAPAYNEEESISAFVAEACAALDRIGRPYELICVDDGSSDGTGAILRSLRAQYRALRPVTLERNSGQSAALAAGISLARGGIIALADSDLQNDPADLEHMLLVLEGAPAWDCVVGVRASRRDSWLRRVSSRIANWCAARITRQRFRDAACGLKVCRAQLLRRVPLFRGAHRFVAQLVAMEGGRVIEVPVNHRPRRAGRSKYGSGLGRTFVALRDALGVRWMMDRKIRVQARELP
jgi:glycosyltransferase involved in cell wall biosynthesis